MNGGVYRVLGWIVPILFLCVASSIIYVQHAALEQAEERRTEANETLNKANQDRALVLSMPALPRFAAVDQSPDEENKFLDDLRAKAHSVGATISGWTSNRTQYGNGGPSVSDPNDAQALAGVYRISCDLKVVGPYQALRKLVGELTGSDRLFTISNINWHRADTPSAARTGDSNELSFSLVRYVAPPGGHSPTSATSSNSPTTASPST